MVIKLDKHVNGLFVKQHARNLKDVDEGPNNNRRWGWNNIFENCFNSNERKWMIQRMTSELIEKFLF